MPFAPLFLNDDASRNPLLAVGTMRLGRWGAGLDTRGYRAFIDACLEAGLAIFDHADIYGDYSTEAEFGAALAEAGELRDQLRLISKCGIQLVTEGRPGNQRKHYNLTKDYIVASAERSLKALQTDRLELLLLHRPDPLMDPDDIAAAFASLQASGKVQAFGVSNFAPHQVEAILRVWPELVTNQVEASPMHRAPFLDGTFDQALTLGMRPMAWSPLAGGRLFSAEGEAVHAALTEMAPRYEVDPVCLVYAWLLQHPAGIVPVTGTANAGRIRQAAKAQMVRMERQDWYAIWTAAGGEVP